MDFKAFLFLFVSLDSIAVTFEQTGHFFEGVGFVFSVLDIVDHSKTDVNSVDLDNILSRITAIIDASNTEIIRAINLQSRVKRVEDADISIQTCMISLKNIIQASDAAARQQYKNQFVRHFEEHGLIEHIRFLPKLLKYNIPGSTGKLIDLLAENTRCNITTFNDFKSFYYDLITDGITLELLHWEWTTEVPLEIHINTKNQEWRNDSVDIAKTFENKENYCKAKFAVYAKEDVQNAKNALRLRTDNNERYTWKKSDVLFSKPYGTFQFLYFSHYGDNLFWHRTTEFNKFAIFSRKEEKMQKLLKSAELSHVLGRIKASIQGDDDINAAKNVGNAFEKYIEDLGYVTENLVVKFDGGEFSREEIILDTDSAVLELSINNTKLTYCYESGFECTMDPLNWSRIWKTVQGQMRVYAYVTNATESMSQLSKQTGTSIRIKSSTLLVYFLVFICVKMNKTIKDG